MSQGLKEILPIQELDMQMIQLMRLKNERQKELNSVVAIKNNLHQQVMLKESEIIEIKKDVRLTEGEVKEISNNIKKLESQQNQVKKVDEFNDLSHEISRAEFYPVYKKNLKKLIKAAVCLRKKLEKVLFA